MASPKKLTRADVFKQIDAFRGVFNRKLGEPMSAPQWVESKRAQTKLRPNGSKTAKAVRT